MTVFYEISIDPVIRNEFRFLTDTGFKNVIQKLMMGSAIDLNGMEFDVEYIKRCFEAAKARAVLKIVGVMDKTEQAMQAFQLFRLDNEEKVKAENPEMDKLEIDSMIQSMWNTAAIKVRHRYMKRIGVAKSSAGVGARRKLF